MKKIILAFILACIASYGYGYKYDPTYPENIRIYTKAPTLKAHNGYTKISEIPLSSTNMLHELEEEAAQLGADAVIIVHSQNKAIAIKYGNNRAINYFMHIYSEKGYAPTDFNKIEMFSNNIWPTKEYVEIFEITASQISQSNEEMIKKCAARNGADAVIILGESRGRFKAIAIKYIDIEEK
jgi:uncharacterized protein YbjQ (UPF0145 family)